jgi:hypothetical protein
MKLYQLFKLVPEDQFNEQLLLCYGLHGFSDTSEFSKTTLRDRDTVNKLSELVPEMIMYYIPCKAEKYLANLDEARAITILRQFIRLKNYKLAKRERVIQKKKIIYYSLQPATRKTISIQQVTDVLLLD